MGAPKAYSFTKSSIFIYGPAQAYRSTCTPRGRSRQDSAFRQPPRFVWIRLNLKNVDRRSVVPGRHQRPWAYRDWGRPMKDSTTVAGSSGDVLVRERLGTLRGRGEHAGRVRPGPRGTVAWRQGRARRRQRPWVSVELAKKPQPQLNHPPRQAASLSAGPCCRGARASGRPWGGRRR